MTDSDFLLHVLRDGEWHSRDKILARSFRERGCGLTVHSRAADLRKRGLTVLCDTENNTTNRRTSFYRLVGALDSLAARTDGNDATSPVSSVASESSASTGVLEEAAASRAVEPAATDAGLSPRAPLSPRAHSSIPAVSPQESTMIPHGRGGDALATSPGVEPFVAHVPTRRVTTAMGESLPPCGDSGSRQTPGDLLLFECHIDESAGLRGAYHEDAAA